MVVIQTIQITLLLYDLLGLAAVYCYVSKRLYFCYILVGGLQYILK